MISVHMHVCGVCTGNPGPGGYGAVIAVAGGHGKEVSGGEKDTTNNRMELQACICAIQSIYAASIITVTTDSNYLKDGVSKWMVNWKNNGWRTSAKKPVKNQDLWEVLDRLIEHHTITWTWVSSKHKSEEGQRAESLARNAVPHGDVAPKSKPALIIVDAKSDILGNQLNSNVTVVDTNQLHQERGNMALFQPRQKTIGAKQFNGANGRELALFLSTNNDPVDVNDINKQVVGSWAVKSGNEVSWISDEEMLRDYKMVSRAADESIDAKYQ